jgi:hypothetical protein
MTSTAITTHPGATSAPTRRATWAMWGAAAGLTGVLTNMVFAPTIGDELRREGSASEVVAELSRSNYHVSAVTGFLTVAFLLMFAAGLARWARSQASDSLALRAAPAGIVASAAALIVAYGVKGQLASYLVGGFNEESYSDSARHLYFMLDDLAGYYGWWGVTVSIACLSYLALRERLVPRWIGALGLLVVLIPTAMLLAFGFTGMAGVVSPVFLVIAGIGLARQRA